MGKERILYLDVLRIFTSFFTVLLHVSASQWDIDPTTFAFQVFNVYDSALRYCVLVFFMLSGAAFLNLSRNITLERLVKKNILHIATAFLFWSFLYSLYSSGILTTAINREVVETFLKNLALGHYHLWFLFAISSMYLLVPFLRKIVADKKLLDYYMILGAVFALVFPMLALLPKLSIVKELTGNIRMFYVFGYCLFFVGGHYFSTYEVSAKIRRYIYLGAFLSILFTILMTSYLSIRAGSGVTTWYSALLPTTASVALAVFLFFKYYVGSINFNEQWRKRIMLFSRCSFGVFLSHELFIILFIKIGFTTTSFNPILSVLVITLCAYIGSFILSYILSRIPVLGKYIV